MGSVMSLLRYVNVVSSVKHHMLNGGCPQEFAVAVIECHPDMIELRAMPAKPGADANACARATTMLRKYFGRNRKWIEHQYIARLGHGLDEDVKPSREQVKKENEWSWRWWNGMRRS